MKMVERQDSGGSIPISRYEESISALKLAEIDDIVCAFLLRTSLFGTEESFGLWGVIRSDHHIHIRAVTEFVRQASRALDASEEGGYQQSIDSKVNEFANHRGGLEEKAVGWGGVAGHVGARQAHHTESRQIHAD